MKHEAITVSEVGRGVSVENIKLTVTPEETLITGQTVNEANAMLEEELLQTETKCCVNPSSVGEQDEKHPNRPSWKRSWVDERRERHSASAVKYDSF